MKIAEDPNTGKFYKDDDGNISEIDVREYSQLQTAMDTGSFGTMAATAGSRLANLPGVRDLFGLEEDQGQIDALRDVRPVSSTIGDVAPYLATAPLSGGVLAQAGIGAATGGMMADEGEGAKDMVLGGVAAPVGSALMRGANYAYQGTKNMASRIADQIAGTKAAGRVTAQGANVGDDFTRAYTEAADTAPVGNLSAEETRIMQRGDDLGMVSLPGVEKGDPALKMMEQSLKYNPMKGSVIREAGKRNQTALNRQAGKAIGLGDDVTKVDAQALAKASDKIGRGYDSIEDQIGKIQFDDAVLDSLSSWESRNMKTILPNRDSMKVVDSLIDNLDKTDSLAGKQLMQYRSRIAKQSRKAWKDGDELQGGALDELVSIMDDTVSRQVGDEVGQQWGNLGRQWKALKSLETGKGVDEISGDVNPLTVANTLKRLDKGGFQRGRNRSDFYDAVRYARMNRDIVGQSGTNVNTASQLPQSTLLNMAMDVSSEPMGRSLLGMMTTQGMKNASRLGGAAGRGLIPFADEQYMD